MEGLGDVAFRRAFVAVGGCVDEACSEFIRLPGVLPPTPRLLAKQAAVLCDAAYRPEELRPWGVPLAAQLMGSEPTFLACATQRLAGHLGAEHVQLNAGCPANTVCGRGAGASLLADTAALRACVEAMARAAAPHGAVLSVKLRLGAGDASQLGANLAACADGGAAFVVLHGRTGAQGYGGRADYGAVGLGVAALAPRGLPVVGNGDVAGPGDAAELLRASGCRGVMAGRGAAADPLLFRRLRAYFAAGAEEEAAASRLPQPQEEPAVVEAFLRTLYAELLASAARRGDSAKAPRFVLSRLKCATGGGALRGGGLGEQSLSLNHTHHCRPGNSASTCSARARSRCCTRPRWGRCCVPTRARRRATRWRRPAKRFGPCGGHRPGRPRWCTGTRAGCCPRQPRRGRRW